MGIPRFKLQRRDGFWFAANGLWLLLQNLFEDHIMGKINAWIEATIWYKNMLTYIADNTWLIPSISTIALGVYIIIRSGRLKASKYLEVSPVTKKQQADWERTEHLMMAELEVKNDSINELLEVQVNITECLTVQEKRDNANEFVMWNHQGIRPFSIYWSERQSEKSGQISMVIPKGAKRVALVAFQDNSNGGQFNFNSLNHEWVVGGAKISVEISSQQQVLWQGEFYIECHPNYLTREFPYSIPSRFEFIEWGTWVKGKNATLLALDT